MPIVLSLIIALLFLSPATALAEGPTDLHVNRVKALLANPVPKMNKLEWMAVGDVENTNARLIELVLDKRSHEIYRVRAIQALAFFPTRRSQQFLWQVVHDRELPDLYKTAALTTLGAAFQVEVLNEVSPYLREASSALREGAIRGMGLIRDPRVLPILRNHLHQEQDLDLRLMVETSIKQVEALEAQREDARKEEIIEEDAKRRLKNASTGESP